MFWVLYGCCHMSCMGAATCPVWVLAASIQDPKHPTARASITQVANHHGDRMYS